MSVDQLFTGFDHVAFATRNTNATVRVLEALGFTVIVYKQPLDKFNVCITKLMSLTGHVAEVVEPLGPNSAVSGVLRDHEAVVYHTCFRTTDFAQARERMLSAGCVGITKPMTIPYPATQDHTTFLASHLFHPYLGVLEVTGPVRERGNGSGEHCGERG